jgi:hypothetical protein
MKPSEKVTPSSVLEYLERREISVWAVARRMKADSTHLSRVLHGKRVGSQKLLQTVLETAMGMRERRWPPRRGEDVDRLIEAAVHVFFVQRGDFESAIFMEADDWGLYGPGRKGRVQQVKKKNGDRPERPGLE